MIGKNLGQFRIIEQLGAGGMGVVYRAHDTRLERDVALKVLPPGLLADEDARRRFRKEALALAKLNHPNIGTLFDFDTHDGTDFLVMEFVAGGSLLDKLSSGALLEKEIAALGVQIAAALEEAHDHGIVHRDLKPGNIALTPKGQVKVLDFGLAKLARPAGEFDATQSIPEPHAAAGTLPYMAPEQLRGEPVDERSDIYALGVVLYEMAAGQRPFQAETSPRLTDAILHAVPPPPSRFQPRLSADLERIILKCLEKDPENRYQSAKEVAVDLRRVGAPSARTSEAPAVPAPRKKTALIQAVAVPLLAVGAVLLVLFGLNVGGLRDRVTGVEQPIDAIAVLPLENLSGDPEQEYFSAGMHEALITELSRIRSIKVISRTSVMGYKGTTKKIPEIARELGVAAIVEGSTVRAGDRVRINIQLIDGRTDKHLWADKFDREYRDILALQSEAALAIARQIQATLTPEEVKAATRTRAVNPEAHELYVKGRFYWNKYYLTGEGLKLSRDYLGQALEKDPGYAPAYAALASCLWESAVQGHVPPDEAFPQAKALLKTALELDDTLAETLTATAATKFFYDWDWAGAELGFQQAIAANPNYADGHRVYGFYLLWMGRAAHSRAEFARALELDPLSLTMNYSLAYGLAYSGRLDEAIKQLHRTLQLDPNYAFGHSVLAAFYVKQSRTAEAIQAAERAVSLSGRSPNLLRTLAQAYAAAGKTAEAQKILEELEQLWKQKRARASDLASVCGVLGRKDQAFQWLEVAYRERDSGLVMIKMLFAFDSLRPDPRFQALLRRMNFPP